MMTLGGAHLVGFGVVVVIGNATTLALDVRQHALLPDLVYARWGRVPTSVPTSAARQSSSVATAGRLRRRP